MQPNNEGILFVLCGATRSGKTVRALKEAARFKRLIIWDVEGQYPAKYRATTPSELFNVVSKLGGQYAGVIAYTGRLSEYDYFCELAYWWGCEGDKNGLETGVILEETSDVTKANWCPENHGILIRRGLKRGISIIAITQRPAESDKTAFSNAGVVVCCRLNFKNDRNTLKDALNVPFDEVANLVASKKLNRYEYIERDMLEGKTHKGCLSFKRRKPVFEVEKPL